MFKNVVQQGQASRNLNYPIHGHIEDFDELRTKLADFFSILLLDIWNLPINRSHPGIDKIAVDL